MQTVTLLIALFASLLILALRPIYGLWVYAAAVFWYSQRLTVEIFTLDFTVQRIVVVALLLRAMLSSDVRHRFHPTVIDAWVVVVWMASFFAFQLNEPMNLVLVREGGALMDTLLPYAAVRLIVNGRHELVRFIQCLALIAVPLAVFGVVQSLTGYNVAGFMELHAAWGIERQLGEIGLVREVAGIPFYRATITFGNYIAYGMYFPCVAALVMALWHERSWPRPFLILMLAIALMGAMASVSSAPVLATMTIAAFACCFPFRRYWPAGVAVILCGILFIEVFSNRHFYHVLSRIAFSGETAYYRIRLFDEAFGGGMNGHWLAGYGYVGAGPGNDNTHFAWRQLDLVNLYIHRLARTGLVGLVPLLMLNIMFYWRLYKAGHGAAQIEDEWLVWAVAGGLVGLNLALMTVTPLEQIMTMFYMLIALANSMPLIVAQSRRRAREYLVVVAVPKGGGLAPEAQS
ncbi:hypothetical protein LLG95_09355 [bacterium]|nr:hypothetical protein [bacterium]